MLITDKLYFICTLIMKHGLNMLYLCEFLNLSM